MLAAQARELRGSFGPKKPRNAGLRSVSDVCVSAARRLVRGLNMVALCLNMMVYAARFELEPKVHIEPIPM